MLAFTPFSLLYSLSFSSNPFLAHSPFLVWGRVAAAAVNVNNVAESWVTAGGALRCGSDGKLFGIEPRVWELKFIVMSLIKALALFKGAGRRDSLDNTIKWCNSFLDRHLWRYYKKTIHLRVLNAPLVNTAFKFSCVHIKKARSDGDWNKEGWGKEIKEGD